MFSLNVYTLLNTVSFKYNMSVFLAINEYKFLYKFDSLWYFYCVIFIYI